MLPLDRPAGGQFPARDLLPQQLLQPVDDIVEVPGVGAQDVVLPGQNLHGLLPIVEGDFRFLHHAEVTQMQAHPVAARQHALHHERRPLAAGGVADELLIQENLRIDQGRMQGDLSGLLVPQGENRALLLLGLQRGLAAGEPLQHFLRQGVQQVLAGAPLR